MATTTLVSIRHANCVCCSSCCPREGSRRAKPCRMDTKTDLRFCEGRRRTIKCFAHAHSVSGSTQHCFAPLEPSRGRQEELHTQFARRMETKVVVATTWLSVGIDVNHPCVMMNNFCFHVYAEKSLFIGENANGFCQSQLIAMLWLPQP